MKRCKVTWHQQPSFSCPTNQCMLQADNVISLSVTVFQWSLVKWTVYCLLNLIVQNVNCDYQMKPIHHLVLKSQWSMGLTTVLDDLLQATWNARNISSVYRMNSSSFSSFGTRAFCFCLGRRWCASVCFSSSFTLPTWTGCVLWCIWYFICK